MPRALNKTVKGTKSTKTVKAKTARRVIKPWTKEDVRMLKAHSKSATPVPKVSKVMKRTVGALRRRAGILGVGLGHRRYGSRLSDSYCTPPPCRLVSQSLRDSGFDLCKRQGVGTSLKVGERLRQQSKCGGLGEAPRGSGKGCAGRIASSIAACDNDQRTVWQRSL
jgi:hypothetical protein